MGFYTSRVLQQLGLGQPLEMSDEELNEYVRPLETIVPPPPAPAPPEPSWMDSFNSENIGGTALRIGAPIVGGVLGSVLAPGPGTALGIASGAGIGAALGGGLGEYGAQKLEDRPTDVGEIALAAGLSAIPAGPFGRMAQGLPAFGKITEEVAKAAVLPSLGKRAALHAAEGAAQSLLDTPSSTLYREGRLPTVEEVGAGMAFGGVLGGGLGLGLERVFRPGGIEEAVSRRRAPQADPVTDAIFDAPTLQRPSFLDDVTREVPAYPDAPLGYTRGGVPAGQAPQAPAPKVRPGDRVEAAKLAQVLPDLSESDLQKRLKFYESKGMPESVAVVRAGLEARTAAKDAPQAPISADDAVPVPTPDRASGGEIGGQEAAPETFADSSPVPEIGTNVRDQRTPRYAYRARNVGEQGIPGVGHSQASLSEADVRRIAPSRSDGPQEVVKVDLSRLKEGDEYEVMPGPGGAEWVRYKRPLAETEVERVGEIDQLDREAASKAEPPLREAVEAAPADRLSRLTGLDEQAVEKGRQDVRDDGVKEFSPEAVAVKRAVLAEGRAAEAELPSAPPTGVEPLEVRPEEPQAARRRPIRPIPPEKLARGPKSDRAEIIPEQRIDHELLEVARILDQPLSSADRRMQYNSRKPELGLESFAESPKQLAAIIRNRKHPLHKRVKEKYWDHRAEMLRQRPPDPDAWNPEQPRFSLKGIESPEVSRKAGPGDDAAEPTSKPGGGNRITTQPTQDEIVSVLRQHPLVRMKERVRRAFLIGSQATGDVRAPEHGRSDVDILLEVEPRPGVTAEQLTEQYRRGLQEHFVKNNIRGVDDSVHPQWEGRRVDTYFTYDANAEARPKVPLSKAGEVPPVSGAKFSLRPSPGQRGLEGAERDENFRRWFGEGQRGANAMGDGTPMKLYHGTGADFTEFRPSEGGAAGPGIYLSKTPNVANAFAGGKEGGNVMPVFARGRYLKMPFNEAINAKEWGERARREGYDGLDTSLGELVVFDPRNIKSATGNRGTFDPASPNIKFAVRPSPGQRGLEGIAEDVAPKESKAKRGPEQENLFGAGALMQPTESFYSKGKEASGPLFTQERDAAVKADKGRQGTFERPPLPAEGRDSGAIAEKAEREGTAKFATKRTGEIDPDALSREVLARMNQRLKAMGYDMRGVDDMRALMKKRGGFPNDDWRAAYEAATGSVEKRKATTSARKEQTPHVDWETVRRLGTTNNPKQAGYIRPDGGLVNMGHEGVRGDDHRIVGGSAGMQEIQAAGYIRWMPESNGLDIAKEPTAQQYRQIQRLAERANGEVILDMESGLGEFDPRNEYYRDAARKTSLEYPEGTKPGRIVGDIRRFFAGEDLPSGPRFATAESVSDSRALRSRIEQTFKPLRVQQTKDGYVMPTPSGKRIVVKPEGEIVFPAEMLEAGYGPKAAQAYREGKLQIAGVTYTAGRDVIIRIADGLELPHEGMHAFLENFASPSERLLIRKKFEAQAKVDGKAWDETAADTYRKWFDKPESQTPMGKFFTRVRDFFLKLKDALFPSAEGVFRKVKSGEPFLRTSGARGEGVNFSTTAYHGSPHDFDKFSSEKIGTGEGAQAYGHGLYFAGKREVAEFYRDKLSGQRGAIPGAATGKSKWLVDGKSVPEGITGHMALDTHQDISGLLYYTKNGYAPQGTHLQKLIENRIERFRKTDRGEHGPADEDMRALADFYDQHVKNVTPDQITERPKGKLYEVDLTPDEGDFLDWDKPLSQQSEKVRAAVARLAEQELPRNASLLRDALQPFEADATTGATIVRLLGRDEMASRLLREQGIPGIRYLDGSSRGSGEGSHNYVIFDDSQVSIKAKFATAPKQPPAMPPPAQAAAPAQPAPQPQISVPAETALNKFQRIVQDRLNRVGVTEQSVRKQGGVVRAPIKELADAVGPKAAAKIERVETEMVAPLVKALAGDKLSLSDLDRYLYAKHAPTRNKIISDRTNGSVKDGSGMADSEAAQILADYQKRGLLFKLDRAATFVRQARDAQVDALLDGGLISKEQAKSWRDTMGDDYVPLRTAEVDAGIGTGQGFDIRGKETKSATGRATKADSPTAFMFQQLQKAIVRAEKNKFDQEFATFVKDNHLFETDKAYTRTELDAQGKVQTVPDPLAAQKDFSYKVNGETHRISIADKDPILDRALRNMSAQEVGEFTRKAGQLTRLYSQMVTTFSPEFMFTNFARDIQTAMANVTAEQGGKIAASAAKGVPAAMKALYHTFRNPRSTSPEARLVREFKEDGGTIGWYSVSDAADLARTLQGRVERSGPGLLNQAKRAGAGIASAIQGINGVVEGGTRLSVYKALRDAGVPRQRAATVARNVSIDFTKRGEMAPWANSFYAFMNANIQGTKRLIDVAVKNPKGRMVAGSIAASGWVLDQYNRANAGDEEKDGINDYDAIPEYVKERNLVLMRGEGKSPLLFPMPYGFNVVQSAGRLLSAATSGAMKPAEAGTALSSAMFNAFNPLGSEADFVQGLTPTVLDPFVQSATNRNFAGNPISPEPFPNAPKKPDSEAYFKNVNPIAKSVAAWLNEKTGGDKVTPGYVSVSPETIEHYAEFLGAGLGRTAMNAITTGESLAKGETPSVRKVPLARRFVYEEQPGQAGQRYREAVQELDDLAMRYRSYREERNIEGTRSIPVSMLRAKRSVDAIDRQIRSLKRAVGTRPDLEERIEALQAKALRIVQQARGAS